MADVPQSESLRQALRNGAEIGLARVLAGEASNKSVEHYINARLSNLLPEEIAVVMDLAKAMLGSGELINSLEPEDEVPPEQIPINGDLFGDEGGGRRTFWFGVWNIPGSDEWYRFSGSLPDLPTRGEIARYAQELAFSYIEAYPGKFPGLTPEAPSDIVVRIIGTERSF